MSDEDRLLASPHLLAHELRTPLAVILGYLAMIRDGDLQGAQMASAIDIALAQGAKLNRVITAVAREAADQKP